MPVIGQVECGIQGGSEVGPEPSKAKPCFSTTINQVLKEQEEEEEDGGGTKPWMVMIPLSNTSP